MYQDKSFVPVPLVKSFMSWSSCRHWRMGGHQLLKKPITSFWTTIPMFINPILIWQVKGSSSFADHASLCKSHARLTALVHSKSLHKDLFSIFLPFFIVRVQGLTGCENETAFWWGRVRTARPGKSGKSAQVFLMKACTFNLNSCVAKSSFIFEVVGEPDNQMIMWRCSVPCPCASTVLM